MDALLVFVQIIIAAMLSPGHILIHLFAFSGLDLCSQFGYTSLGQSRGEISPVFREIEYGSTGCYSGSVYGRHGFYPGKLLSRKLWPASGRRLVANRADRS